MNTDNSPFQYCTRCGDELPDQLKAAYTDADAPEMAPLCAGCISEILGRLNDSMATILEEQVKTIHDAFQPLLNMADGISLPEESEREE